MIAASNESLRWNNQTVTITIFNILNLLVNDHIQHRWVFLTQEFSNVENFISYIFFSIIESEIPDEVPVKSEE